MLYEYHLIFPFFCPFWLDAVADLHFIIFWDMKYLHWAMITKFIT